MTTDNSIQRTEDLLQRLFDAELTDEEGRELLTLWDRNPILVDEARKNYQVESLFRFLALLKRKPLSFQVQRQLSVPDFFDPAELARLATESPSIQKETSVEIPPTSAPIRVKAYSPEKPGWFPWLAVPCLLLFGIAVYFEFHPGGKSRTSFRPIARVDAAVDVVWSEGTETYKVGQELESGKIRFERGLLELTLRKNVRIALEGPVDFQLNSASQTFCGLGKLSVTVAPEGRGFEVVTPLATVVDLGTEFYLDVAEDKVETHTITGRVDLTRLPENREQLPAGNAFRIRSDGEMQRMPADPAFFLAEREVSRRVAEADRRDLERWRTQAEAAQADPSLLVHFDFEEPGDMVRNLAGSGIEGRILSARRTQGRWQGKSALEFKRKGDAVELDVPGEFRSLMLVASVRIDALDRSNHVLFSSRDFGAGHVIWQILSDGSLQWTIQKEASRSAARFASPPVLTRKYRGAWYRLAVAVDAERKTVSHYVDGRRVAEIPMPEVLPMRIERATLGNGFWKDGTTSDRSLDGCVEEFRLYDRTFPPPAF